MTTTTSTPPRPTVRERLSAHRNVTTLVFLVTLVVGSAVRIVGLTWGLPVGLHPDEGVIVRGALDLAARNSFEPSVFMRPDHVEIQLSYVGYQLWAHLVMGTSVAAAYASDPGTFLLISRLVTALFGIATIVLAFLIGRRFDPRIGAVAAIAFALLPLYVRDSHYATPDIPLLCMLMVVVLATMHYLDRARVVPLLLACAATSVGIAIKYPAALATLMIALVVIICALRDRRPLRIVTHGALAVVAVVVFLFLVSPVLFTNFHEVRQQLSGQSGSVHPGQDGLGWGGNLGFYARTYVENAGLLLTLFGFVGVFAAIRGRMLQAVPLTLGAIYWLTLSVLPLHWDRWGLPMFLTPLLFAAIGLVHAYRWVGAREWRAPAAWVVGVLVVADLLAGAVAWDAQFLADDTRLTARADVAERGIDASNTAFEGYTVLLPGAFKTVFEEFRTVDGRLEPIDPRVRYVFLSDCMSARYYTNDRFTEERAFYRAVREDFTPVATYARVKPRQGSIFEPQDIVADVRTTFGYLTGDPAGCTMKVFAVR